MIIQNGTSFRLPNLYIFHTILSSLNSDASPLHQARLWSIEELYYESNNTQTEEYPSSVT